MKPKRYEQFILIYFQLILTMFLWGGTFIAAKSISLDINPYSASFLRFAIASIFLLILVIKKEKRIPALNLRQFIILLFLGLTGIYSYNIFFFKGLQTIEASKASIIIATNPIFISLFSAILFKTKLNRFQGLGILISVFGAVMVISKGHFSTLSEFGFGAGESFIFLCVVSWVLYSILGKLIMDSLSPLVSVFYSSLFGAVFLFIPAVKHQLLSDITQFSTDIWYSVFYLGVFGTVIGFTLYYEGVKKIGPMKAGIFINIVPVSAIILSYIFFKETLTLSAYMGGVLVLFGVYMTNFSDTVYDFILRMRHRQFH